MKSNKASYPMRKHHEWLTENTITKHSIRQAPATPTPVNSHSRQFAILNIARRNLPNQTTTMINSTNEFLRPTMFHVFFTIYYRADSRFAPCQWEMALLCNDISHWLGANLESALYYALYDQLVTKRYFDMNSFSLRPRWWHYYRW